MAKIYGNTAATPIKPDAFSGSENWRLINETTLTEDAYISFTQDKDGNPFSLKKLKVYVVLPSLKGWTDDTAAKPLWLYINGVLLAATHSGISVNTNSPAVYMMCEPDVIAKWRVTTVVHSSNATSAGQLYTAPMGHRYTSGTVPDTITSAGFSFTSSKSNLPTGTMIKIWGVDA